LGARGRKRPVVMKLSTTGVVERRIEALGDKQTPAKPKVKGGSKVLF